MANNTGKSVASLLIGAAVGVAAGYILATDKEKRDEDMKAVKKRLSSLKGSLKEKVSVSDYGGGMWGGDK